MKKELRYKENKKLTLSASKINLFYECPRKYFYRYLYIWEDEKLQSTSWPGSGFGDAIHKILEFTTYNLKEGEKDLIRKAEGKFKEYFDKWLMDNEKTFKKSKDYTYKSFIEKGEKYAKLIVKFYISYFNDFIDILPEKKFEVPYEYSKYDVSLNGIIDLVYFFEEGFSIIDFKTTKESSKFYFVDWVIDTQSLIYLYYSLKEYKQIPTSFSYLILNHIDRTLFFKDQMVNEIDNEKKFFKGLTSQINDVCKYTLKPDFDLHNSSQKTCFWCEYESICELRYKSKITNLWKGVKK